jgi:hypothetical protein
MKHKTIPVQWLNLLVYCLHDLRDYGVDVELCPTTKVRTDSEDDSWSRGFWDDNNNKELVLKCATKREPEQWLPVFAHEYCHFRQWRDRCQVWHDNRKITSAEWSDILHNVPMKKQRLIKVITAVRNIELDCEKRTVKLFKKFKLPDSFIKEYIRNANVYIFYQTYLLEYRRWYRKKGIPVPYENPNLLKLVNTTFYKDYDVIPSNLLKAFRKYYPTLTKSRIY